MNELFPLVAGWFAGRYGEPTEPQIHGWPLIRAGGDVLGYDTNPDVIGAAGALPAAEVREVARSCDLVLLSLPDSQVVGGSGGALAIAVADRVLMLENSIYSVISPEGCAAIMWRDSTKKELAAEAMRITAPDLEELGCIDDIVPEPEGGAHRDHEAAANLLDVVLQKHLAELKKVPAADLVVSRYNKFRNMAQFFRTES